MTDDLLQAEPLIRTSVSLGLFAALALCEAVVPRRGRPVSRRLRWPNNLGVTLLDGLLVRILLPTSAVGFGEFATARGWGLFNLVAVPAWLAMPCAVVLLDAAVYAQHFV